jgi:hypothetical protein
VKIPRISNLIFGLAFIAVVFLAIQVWPNHQDIINVGSVSLLLFAMGAFALTSPQNFVKHIDATNYVRLHIYRNPCRMRTMGLVFVGVAVFVFGLFVVPKL